MSDKYICDTDFSNIQSINDLLEWRRWYETFDRQVALTEMHHGKVSTVFLGLDHNFGAYTAEAVLFETMIFAGGYPCDQEQQRAATLDDARRNHEELVAVLRRAGPRLK